ncbi:MAG: stage III sporulation protein AD [Peptostreptococcaceae bacterium]
MQLIGVSLISTIICLIIKKDRPEIAMFIGILAGTIIIMSVMFKLNFMIDAIENLAQRANIPNMYITLIIKLIGIAYLMEFAIQICNDCGEGTIASKLEFGGKIIVMTMSFPILLSIIEMVLDIIP